MIEISSLPLKQDWSESSRHSEPCGRSACVAATGSGDTGVLRASDTGTHPSQLLHRLNTREQSLSTSLCTHARRHRHTHTHTPSGALNPVSPFLHSQMFGKKQTFSSASISSSRNPATPRDPRSSPLVPGRSLGHPVSGHSLWPLGSTTSLFPLALLIPAFVS